MQLLITRLEPQATELANLALELACHSVVLPQISIAPVAEFKHLHELYTADIVIAVSKNAVIALNQCLLTHNKQWPETCQYLAVGKSTAETWFRCLALQSADFLWPISPEVETSEGLLALNDLQAVAGKKIVILRGDSGRELLADTLNARAGILSYISCYQRQPIEANQRRLTQLIQLEARAYLLIATSAELLTLSVKNLSSQQVNRLSVIVPSGRVAMLAKKLGFLSVYQSQGATNTAIISEIKKHRHLL